MSGDCNEVGTAVEILFPTLAHETDERLVYEGGRLQGVSGALAPEIARREAMQLAIDDLHDLAQSRLIALPPIA
jgi:hypothetical protein